ncbi:MAG: hypothetical protein WAX48_09900 [Desulfosalsimonadaceae bacterium]
MAGKRRMQGIRRFFNGFKLYAPRAFFAVNMGIDLYFGVNGEKITARVDLAHKIIIVFPYANLKTCYGGSIWKTQQ